MWDTGSNSVLITHNFACTIRLKPEKIVYYLQSVDHAKEKREGNFYRLSLVSMDGKKHHLMAYEWKDTSDKVTKYIFFLVLLILSSLLTICFLRSIESFPFGIPVRTRLILYDPVRYWGNKESLYFVLSLNSA